MKKRIIGRGLLGLVIGIAVGFIIALLLSVYIGDGTFYPVRPELTQSMGNELNAVIAQTILCALLGAGFGMASVIWEIDAWSIARQTGVYFAIACAIMFPVAYFANWMEHSLGGVLSFVLIFVLIFFLAWIIQYALWKNRIKKINAGIHPKLDRQKN